MKLRTFLFCSVMISIPAIAATLNISSGPDLHQTANTKVPQPSATVQNTPSPTAMPTTPPVPKQSNPDGLQTKKVTKILEGTISGYECGGYCDAPCWLTITDDEGTDHAEVCWTRLCDKWYDNGQTMPERYKGKRVRVTVEKATDYDSEGNDHGTWSVVKKIKFLK